MDKVRYLINYARFYKIRIGIYGLGLGFGFTHWIQGNFGFGEEVAEVVVVVEVVEVVVHPESE